MSLSKITYSATKATWQTVFAAVSAFLITWVWYAIAYPFLSAGYLTGNDSGIHLTYAKWIQDHWTGLFGRLPYWNAQQGMGVSLSQGYPISFHKLVVWVSQVSPYSLEQSIRLVPVLGLLLAALGVFVLGWVVWKSQLIGLLAAILFLLTPLTWGFLYIWGFLPYVFSFGLVPWCLVLFFVYRRAFLKGFNPLSNKGQGGLAWPRSWALWLLLNVVGLVTLTMVHTITAISVIITIAILTLTSFLFDSSPGSSKLIKRFGRSFTASAILGGCYLAVVAFWLAPFTHYALLSNRDGLQNVGIDMLPQFLWQYFFGKELYANSYDLRGLNLIWWIVLSSIGGLVTFLLARRRLLGWALIAILATLFTWAPSWLWGIYDLPFMSFALGPRTMVAITIVLIPMWAASFLWDLPDLMTRIPGVIIRLFNKSYLSNKSAKIYHSIIGSIRIALVTLACFGLFVVALDRFKDPEPDRHTVGYTNYGYRPHFFSWQNIWSQADDICAGEKKVPSDRACQPVITKYLSPQGVRPYCQSSAWSDPNLCRGNLTEAQVKQAVSLCDDSFNDPAYCYTRLMPLWRQLWPGNWPDWKIGDKGTGYAKEVSLITGELEEAGVSRIDISPYLGHLSQQVGYVSELSFPNLFTFQLSLNHYLWGYEQGALFTPGRASGREASNLGWYWGLEEVLLAADEDYIPQVENNPDWQRQNWLFAEGSGSLPMSKIVSRPPRRYKYRNSPGLLTFSSHSATLVIGQFSVRSYETVFRLANQGVLPYQRVILAEGEDSGNIDDYTLDDLTPFTTLILHGYQYRNKYRAYKLLEQYLTQGGNIFIDTGWQYTSPDWQLDEPPAWWPTGKLVWEQITSDPVGSSLASIASGPTFGQKATAGIISLASLGFSNEVSAASINELPSDSQVLLSAGDKALIVSRQVGAGKVIWSGINLIPRVYASDEGSVERELLANLILGELASSTPEQPNYRSAGSPSSLDKQLTGGTVGQPVSYTLSRPHPDRVEITINQDLPSNIFLYWREVYHPWWSSFVLRITDGDAARTRTDLPVRRTGPEMMGVHLPSVEQGDTVVFEFKPAWWVYAAKLFSLAVLFLLTLLAFEGMLFRNRFTLRILDSLARSAARLVRRTTEKVVGEEDELDRDAGVR